MKAVVSHSMGQIEISRVLFWRSNSYNGSYKGVTLVPDLLVKFVKLLFVEFAFLEHTVNNLKLETDSSISPNLMMTRKVVLQLTQKDNPFKVYIKLKSLSKKNFDFKI